MARTRRRWRNILLGGKERCTRNVEEERRKERGKGNSEEEEKTNKKS